MNGKPKILVVGSMNMDLMVYGMERIPAFGESVPVKSYCYADGGKGSNQAYACARMGASVTMVGRVGDDSFGRQLVWHLEEAGVNCRYVVKDPDCQTGFDPILVNPEGKYVSVVAMGANNALSAQDVQRALDAQPFDMVVMQLEMPLETVYRTYEMAAERKIPVFLDAGPAMSISLERLRGIFLLSPNEAETRALTGIQIKDGDTALAAARWLYDRAAPQYVLLKLGARGALIYDGKTTENISTFNIKVLDTTAAGDTFGAALAVRLCSGSSMRDAVIFANAAATICVSRYGAQPSIPYLEEVERFLKEHGVGGI